MNAAEKVIRAMQALAVAMQESPTDALEALDEIVQYEPMGRQTYGGAMARAILHHVDFETLRQWNAQASLPMSRVSAGLAPRISSRKSS